MAVLTATSLTTTGSTAATGIATLTYDTSGKDTLSTWAVSGTYGTVQIKFEVSFDGTNFAAVGATRKDTGAVVTGTISLTDNTTYLFDVPGANYAAVRLYVVAIASGTLSVTAVSDAFVGVPSLGSNSSGNTFSGATFSGTASTFSTMPIFPTATVAATGSVQGDAASVATGFTLATGADGTVGVKLPAAAAGLQCTIKNNTNAVLKVWPATGDAINAIAANSSLSMAALTSAVFTAYDATTWYSTPTVPS